RRRMGSLRPRQPCDPRLRPRARGSGARTRHTAVGAHPVRECSDRSIGAFAHRVRSYTAPCCASLPVSPRRHLRMRPIAPQENPMKPLTRIACAFALALPLGGSALAMQAAPAATSADQAFTQLADQYFDDYYFPANPSAATADGLHAWDGKLEDYSRTGVDANIKA